MTRLTPLIERNQRIAADYAPVPLAPPTSGVLILSCLDHRLPPELVLGLESGEAPVIRNAGGRGAPAGVPDNAVRAVRGGPRVGEWGAADRFEVAVIHHTQCGTGFLGDAAFRREASQATGISERDLATSVVLDPTETVRDDVRRLLEAPEIPPTVSVSGHVYDLATGRLATITDASHPERRS